MKPDNAATLVRPSEVKKPWATRLLPRAAARERRYYQRQRIGATLIPTPLKKGQWEGLLRLGLIHEDADKHAIGWAIGRLLDAAEHLAAVGIAIFPEGHKG